MYFDEVSIVDARSKSGSKREEFKVPDFKGYRYQPAQRVGSFSFSRNTKSNTNEFLFSNSKKNLLPMVAEWKTGVDNWNGLHAGEVAPELVN